MPSEDRRRPRRTMYQPLTEYLGMHNEQDVTLTFAEIEALIGRPLAVSASNDPGTWHSTVKPHVRQWRAIGWHARFDRRGQCVHFTRDEEAAADVRQ